MNWFKRENPLLEILKDQNSRLKAQTEWLEHRVESLTEQILSMKKENYSWTPPIERPNIPLVDERIMAAIRSRAPEGSKLERELYDFANGQLVMEREVEDVVDMILAGAQVD